MRILATGNRRRQRGLTLVETLVVLAIIGLLASVVVLTLPAVSDDTEEEAYKLARHLRSAHELAIMRSQAIGLKIEPSTYTFLEYRNARWSPAEFRRTASRHALPEGMILEFQYSGFVAPGTAGINRRTVRENANETGQQQMTPEVIYQPTGEVTALEITLSGEEEVWLVSQSPSGAVLVRQRDE